MACSAHESTHPLAGKHIIVAGAGIAGLAFVRGFIRSWTNNPGVRVQQPKITICERDPRQLPPDRGSYSLGLRSDSASLGMQALQNLGLFDEIFAARAVGSELPPLVRDANWNTIFRVKTPTTPPDGLPSSHMRITRNRLRECLIKGVANHDGVEMKWEIGCNSATRTKSGGIEVALSDGTIEECDLLVVADGASSKLRSCLRPDDPLEYAGAVMIGGNATFPSLKDVPEKLQHGIGPILGGDGHGLVVFHIEESSFVWFVTRRSPKPRTPIKGAGAVEMQEEIRKEALAKGKVFAEPFPSLIAATDPTTLKIMNAMDKPPISHVTSEFPSVVFIGDANHAVSPFAGNGANMALKDGVSLAESLCNSSSLPEAIRAFDKESIPRCASTRKKSHVVIRLAHSTGWLLWLVLMFLRIANWLLVR